VKETQNPAVDDRISWRRQLSWLHFKVEVVVAGEEAAIVDPDMWLAGVDRSDV
jgi:hypothetical protein